MPTVMIDGKKHTPGSNTLKKMKRKAAAEAAAKASAPTSKPKGKKKKAAVAKEKAPIPAKRSMKDKVRVPKGPMSPGGRTSHFKGHTKGGNAGDKTSKFMGVGPGAKLSTDGATANANNKRKLRGDWKK